MQHILSVFSIESTRIWNIFRKKDGQIILHNSLRFSITSVYGVCYMEQCKIPQYCAKFQVTDLATFRRISLFHEVYKNNQILEILLIFTKTEFGKISSNSEALKSASGESEINSSEIPSSAWQEVAQRNDVMSSET